MKKTLFAVALILSMTACKKEEEVNATITISSPTITDTLALGDTLQLTGMVSGTGEMHGYSVMMMNLTTSAMVYSSTYDIHADLYTVSDFWVNSVSDTSVVEATIDVIKDHEGNHEMKTISVVCLPQ
jgi:hypothetical protein